MSRPLCQLYFLLIFFFSAQAQAALVHGPQDYSLGWARMLLAYDQFTAAEAGEGLLRLEKIVASQQVHGGFIYINGQVINISSFGQGEDQVFEQAVILKATNRLVLVIWGDRGGAISLQIAAQADQAVVIEDFTASPVQIPNGETATLSWVTSNSETVTVEPGIGEVDQSGSLTVTPAVTTIYTLTAANQGDLQTQLVTVTVLPPPPTAELSATLLNIATGETTELIWETDGAESVTINQEIGTVEGSGSIKVTPVLTTDYTLTAINAGGSASAKATISVVPLRLVIEPPLDQVSTPAASIPVKGRVITTASYAQVAVNSQPALVNNKEFLLPEFSLESGQNSVTVHATDSNGNSTEAMLTVNRTTTLNWLEIQMDIKPVVSLRWPPCCTLYLTFRQQ